MHLFCRPQVPGAIAGPLLGEAAHRLLKNTLNIKTNNSSSGSWEQSSRQNFPGNYTVNRPRPAGPSGYQRGFTGDPNFYHGHYNNFQGMMARPRPHLVPNGVQGERQNLRTQDRLQHLEDFHALTIEGSARTRPPTVMSPATISIGMPNFGHSTDPPNQFVQNMGAPPIPPPKWINRAPAANGGMYNRQQETASSGIYEKQVKKVYQVKTRSPNDMSDSGNHSQDFGIHFQDMSPSGNQQ